jgi:hypothetical protein
MSVYIGERSQRFHRPVKIESASGVDGFGKGKEDCCDF